MATSAKIHDVTRRSDVLAQMRALVEAATIPDALQEARSPDRPSA